MRDLPTKPPIKIATSAGRDVLLYANGAVECGRVRYHGKRAHEFRDIYSLIDNHLRRYRINKRDVSGPRILSIEDLADDMVEKWQATITVSRVQRLAAEARIHRLIAELICPVFMNYLNSKWRREFPKMNDEERIRHSTADKLY
jgi:hypothetical protein